MLRVRVSNGTERKDEVMNGATTLAQAFELAGIDCSSGTILVNGKVYTGNLGVTFDDLGITDSVKLSRAGNKQNA